MSHELWLRQAYEVLAARGDHTLANTCRQVSVAFAILRRELAEAKAENERLKTLADERSKLFYQVVAERDQLKSCEVDARRYRLDTAIDAALAQSQPAPSAAQIDDAISGSRVDVAPLPLSVEMSNTKQNRNRPALNPGGVECERCGRIFIGEEWQKLCAVCVVESVPLEPLASEHAVPVGHFWRGEINRFYCKNCGCHHDDHTHTDEASRCPAAKLSGTQSVSPVQSLCEHVWIDDGHGGYCCGTACPERR